MNTPRLNPSDRPVLDLPTRKVGRLSWPRRVYAFPFSFGTFTLMVGDMKGIWPVKITTIAKNLLLGAGIIWSIIRKMGQWTKAEQFLNIRAQKTTKAVQRYTSNRNFYKWRNLHVWHVLLVQQWWHASDDMAVVLLWSHTSKVPKTSGLEMVWCCWICTGQTFYVSYTHQMATLCCIK